MSGDENSSMSQSGPALCFGKSILEVGYLNELLYAPGRERLPVSRSDERSDDRVWKDLDEALLELAPRPRELAGLLRVLTDDARQSFQQRMYCLRWKRRRSRLDTHEPVSEGKHVLRSCKGDVAGLFLSVIHFGMDGKDTLLSLLDDLRATSVRSEAQSGNWKCDFSLFALRCRRVCGSHLYHGRDATSCADVEQSRWPGQGSARDDGLPHQAPIRIRIAVSK